MVGEKRNRGESPQELDEGDEGDDDERTRASNAKANALMTRCEERAHSEQIQVLCLELGCGRGASHVRAELNKVMEQFPAAQYLRINLEDDEEFPPEAWRERSLSFKSGIDEAFVAIHALVKPKATDYCRYLVKDRDGVARDVYAPTCASPLRLIFRLELSGVKMDYDLAQHQNSEPSVIVFMPSGNPEYNDLAQPLPLKCFWRPSDAMKKREHGIKEALASFQLLHIRFHPAEHSKEVREKMSWCRSLLDDLLKAFRRPEVREALTSKTDRKGVADAVKAVQKEVLPAHGLGAEEHDWTAVQWKTLSTIQHTMPSAPSLAPPDDLRMWFYGYLDPVNERLVSEALALSNTRRFSTGAATGRSFERRGKRP
eukprot:g6857.t1